MKSKKISYTAILSAFSTAIYIVESFLPVPIAVPGVRWGFSNFPLIIAAQSNIGFLNVVFIAIVKSVFGSLMSGRFLAPTFFMGFFGGLSSAVVMYVMSKTKKFGILGISETGAFFSNVVQILIAGVFYIKSYRIVYYLPYMVFFGVITAFINYLIVISVMRSVKIDV